MYTILESKTRRVEKQVLDFTKDLISTPSISLEEQDVARLVQKKMEELEYDKVFQDEWGNVVGVIYGQAADPVVVLNSHMDTVPTEKEEWSDDPYEPHVKDGDLYGLGSSDCKGGLASQIFAGAILKHSMLPLRGTLVVAATVAEENGRSLGVKGLIDHTLPSLGLKPDYFILGEPTALELMYGHNGWVDLNILVEGQQPFHVEDVANDIYRDLEKSRFRRTDDGDDDIFQVLPPEFENEGSLRRGTIQLSQNIDQNDSIQELAFNVKKSASHLAENYGAVAVKVDVKQENQTLYTGKTVMVRNVINAWATDPYHPLIERARQTLAAAGMPVKPTKWQLNRLQMGTAGSVLVNEYKIPTIGYGPGLLDAAHTANEKVPVDNLSKATYGTAAMIHGLIGVPVFGWTSDDI